MKQLIKNLFTKLRNEQTETASVVMIDPPDLDFNDLKNNFYQRSYNFDLYQSIRQKIETLEYCEKHYVLHLTKQIKFAIKKNIPTQ